MLKELKDQQNRYVELTTQNRTLEESASVVEYLQKEIIKAKEEKRRIMKDLETLSTNPFIKKESANTETKTVNDLERKLEGIQQETKRTQSTIL